MKDKTTKWLVIGVVLSAVVMIVGYFLWTSPVPLQDVESYSPQELRDAQRELAVNYPLGSLLLNVGFVGFSSTLLALVLKQILSLIKKKE